MRQYIRVYDSGEDNDASAASDADLHSIISISSDSESDDNGNADNGPGDSDEDDNEESSSDEDFSIGQEMRRNPRPGKPITRSNPYNRDGRRLSGWYLNVVNDHGI